MTPPPPQRNIYLSFIGVGQQSGYQQSFDALCGANPPTIVEGYAQYTNLKRPLQRSLSIFTGYDPMAMKIEIIQGSWSPDSGWAQDDTSGANVETDIGKLEWMAGSNFTAGPPPAIYCWSYLATGGPSDLIPPQYRFPMPWTITSLEWGLPIRNPNGYRIWAPSSFTLTNLLDLSKPPPPDTTAKGGWFKTTALYNTALKIAGAPSGRNPVVDHSILAGRICIAKENNPIKGTNIKLQRKSVYWPIPINLEIWVPQHKEG